MIIERLYIENQYIPMSKGVNPSITSSILDLSEPDKRKSDVSKTVTLPRSQEIDKVFSHIFETNLANGTFNPNQKATMRYEVDNTIIMNGYLRLTKINITDTENITYDVVLYGTTANFFSGIKDLYMTDLDYSRYNHPFTKEIQQLSWEDEIFISGSLEPFELGIGYVYPLIDYGLSQNATDFVFTQIACCLYEHDLMKSIIADAGFTYTSNFLDSDYFKHFIIDSSPDVYNLTTAEIEDRNFAANTPELTSTGTTTSNDLTDIFSTPDTIIFTNEVVDDGGNYDNTTGEWTVVNTGIYDINTLVDINATFDPSTGTAVKTTCEVIGFVQIWYTPISTGVPVLADSAPFYIAPNDTSFTIGSRSTNATPSYPSYEYLSSQKYENSFPFSVTMNPKNVNPPDRIFLNISGVPLNAGDIVEIKWKAKINTNKPNRFVDVFNSYYNGDVNLTISVGSFYNQVANSLISEGNTLLMSKVLPQKLKQLDYFMANVKRFNLMVDIDPTNEKNLIIEPRDDYYTDEVYNIHELIDHSKTISQELMSTLEGRKFYYTYKPDVDFWNKKHTADWDRVYGDRTIFIDTAFLTGEKNTELIFSPTTLVAFPNSNRVLPTILDYDSNNNPISVKHNLRSLYYGGLKPCLQTWNHINYVSVFGIPFPTTYSSYPYAGHFDDPFNPTEDINFGLVPEVYYDGNIDTVTVINNNIWNKYHSRQVREIADKRSRFVRCEVHMTPQTYNKFKFYKLYFFNESYYRLHKIEGYNPTSPETTTCEFLLLNNASIFVPTNIPVIGDAEGVDPFTGDPNIPVDAEEVTPVFPAPAIPNGNTTDPRVKSQQVNGKDNYINKTALNIDIYGDNNKVFSGTSNIKIHGSGNTIESGVKNVVLINTNDLTIEESDVTYIDGVKAYGDPRDVVEINSNTTAAVDVKTYLIDASAGAVDLTFDTATTNFSEGQTWYVKALDVTNTVRVVISGGTVDGSIAEGITSVNDAIEVQYYDGNFYIVSNKNTSGGGGSGLSHGEVMGRVDLGF